MGYIQVDKITDCLCEPLRRCLKDPDPYVRKTAAICVPKLFMHDRNMVENEGFLDQLKDLLNDVNPTVLSFSPLILFICLFVFFPVVLKNCRIWNAYGKDFIGNCERHRIFIRNS